MFKFFFSLKNGLSLATHSSFKRPRRISKSPFLRPFFKSLFTKGSNAASIERK